MKGEVRLRHREAAMEEMKTSEVLVRLVDGTTITGKTNIKDFPRLSDCMNLEDNPFVTLFDVSLHGYAGQVVLVNKSQIMWAMPRNDKRSEHDR
jgi:hypothetical protein